MKPGNEGVELSARLSEASGLIERHVSWTLRVPRASRLRQEHRTRHVTLPPGDYAVEAHYGTANFTQSFTLLEGNRLIVSFVLDVGGIRVLPA